MFPPGTRGRARGLPYTMDAFMLGMGMLGKCRSPRGPVPDTSRTQHSETSAGAVGKITLSVVNY